MPLFGKRHGKEAPTADARVAERLPASTSMPDRITVWPLERARVGVDLTFLGATGGDRARDLEHALRAAHVPCTTRPEGSGAWTLRMTVPPAAAGEVVDHFLASAR